MATSNAPYHHGDLPSALVRAAVELLEEGGAGELSLRAAARRAGV
ncbi:TetR family transcriptional regulator, partial [Nocardia sp. NPDC059154]